MSIQKQQTIFDFHMGIETIIELHDVTYIFAVFSKSNKTDKSFSISAHETEWKINVNFKMTTEILLWKITATPAIS